MSKIFQSLENFIIQKSIVKATILKGYEKVKYEIDFFITKNNNYGPNHWDLTSNIEGFEFIGAYNTKGEKISDNDVQRENLNGGLVRVRLLLDNHLDSDNNAQFTLKYINKIESELLNERFLRKSYGVILTRSFGSRCLQYTLSVSIENIFYYIKKVIPRFHFKKDQEFCFIDIPTQKPTSVALIIPNKVEKIYVVIAFLLTALGGYYIPIWFKQLIELI